MNKLDPSGDVIADKKETSSDVITEKSNVLEEKTSNDVIIEDASDTQENNGAGKEAQQASPRPQINIDGEWRRKYEGLVDNLPKLIEEQVTKVQQPKEREYTVSELESFAQQNPEHRPWVEEQKLKLIEDRIGKRFDEQRKADVERVKHDQIRSQAEQQVVNDQRFSEAFIVNANGAKTINPQSKLAQLMSSYMEEMRRDGINRPDAILIAAKLARADLLDVQNPQTEQKLDSIKRQNQQLKSKMMIEGGGQQTGQSLKDSFVEARERLAKTGTRKDAQMAVKEYLRKIRKAE